MRLFPMKQFYIESFGKISDQPKSASKRFSSRENFTKRSAYFRCSSRTDVPFNYALFIPMRFETVSSSSSVKFRSKSTLMRKITRERADHRQDLQKRPLTRECKNRARLDYTAANYIVRSEGAGKYESSSLQSARAGRSREFATSFVVKEFYCIFFINKSGSLPGGLAESWRRVLARLLLMFGINGVRRL